MRRMITSSSADPLPYDQAAVDVLDGDQPAPRGGSRSSAPWMSTAVSDRAHPISMARSTALRSMALSATLARRPAGPGRRDRRR